ncbi:Gfo/Idh/MocA family oxidoreductase [uncultured Maricaulis sp.]|uniref:Gfo/Idh/MocA family protein n=1 Tax=uncultured Maricaulis sp. TaxID=174710 RepID=UPI002607F2A6|nr:Gfo/Idh/MocA family oxidoreductase [uncultured Maricaulis sp.]
MTAKTWRWGMIGCGDVTERKSGPAYQQARNSELVAVWARRPEQATAYAARHRVATVCANLEDLLNHDTVDAIYIATPPASHPELAEKVAGAGKPCCIEKPLANTGVETEAITSAFEAAGQPLFVAYYRRSLPRFAQIGAWIDAGEIGAVRHVEWRLTREPNATDLAGLPNWRTEIEAAPGGYFDDLACHGLDLFDHLIGPLVEASGQATHQHTLYTSPSAFAASWQHANGATGSGFWNFAAFGHEDHVRILGSHGEIRFSVFDDAALEVVTEAGTTRIMIDNPDPVQLPHVEGMVTHLNGGAPHPSLASNSLRIARALDAIRGPR